MANIVDPEQTPCSMAYGLGLHMTHGVSLKKLQQQGISEPKFYDDLVVTKLEKLRGNLTFQNNSESLLTLVLLNRIYPGFANSVDLDQLAPEEANWSGSALFAIKYANL